MFITEKLGSQDVYRSGLNLKESYKESSARTPLVLIHSHGKLPAPGGDDDKMCQTTQGSGFRVGSFCV